MIAGSYLLCPISPSSPAKRGILRTFGPWDDGIARLHYRLRVGDIRVFYDVSEGLVEVLAIVSKKDATKWLTEVGGSR